jgi:hypothetical protein
MVRNAHHGFETHGYPAVGMMALKQLLERCLECRIGRHWISTSLAVDRKRCTGYVGLLYDVHSLGATAMALAPCSMI